MQIRVRDAFRSGVITDKAMTLPSVDAWNRFAAVWDETDRIVRDKYASRMKLGHEIAERRMQEQKHETIIMEERERAKDGGFTGPWLRRRDPDEWVTTRWRYRPGGGQFIDQVRIMPGEIPQLDEITMEWRLAEIMRRDAVKRFLETETNRR